MSLWPDIFGTGCGRSMRPEHDVTGMTCTLRDQWDCPRSASGLRPASSGRQAKPERGAAIGENLLCVQVVLEIKGEAQLLNLASKLQEAGVRHKLWVEQPEDFPTCLATAPLDKDSIQQHFKRLKLCKGA